MKAIHPKWYQDAKVVCACGNSFSTGATVPEITVEVCSACHPFYTGQMKMLDTAGRVDAFKAKVNQAQKKVLSKSERRQAKRAKRMQDELSRPESLEDLRKSLKVKKKNKSTSS